VKKNISPYNPANLLSLGRITLVPIFIVLMKDGRELAAFACFACASITDFFDGWVARRFGWQTRLGAFIDPLGDKMLTLSALVLLNLQGRLPFWIVVLAFAREVMVVAGYVLIAVVSQQTALKISRIGKLGTLLQMLFLGLNLGLPALGWTFGLQTGLMLGLEIAVVLNFISGLDYAARGIHDFEKNRRGQKA
jgi:CDP-diacylglycerol--glycerol-3-phosphate 3-phosphatidyltransferase